MKSCIYKVGIIIVAAAFSIMGTEIGAVEFPNKRIQVLVGWPVGSTNDSIDRVIAQSLQNILGQPIIIQNVPGGAGAVVLGRIKTEKADGYTLFQTGTSIYSQIPHTRAVPFDSLKDFAYLASHARFQALMEDLPGSPWKNFEELIQYAKKNPKKIKYGTTGTGTGLHLLMENMALRENLQWIHVPFNSSVEVTASLLGGHTEISCTTMGNELEQILAGRIRPLICLNDKRMPLFPDIPTIVEKGSDLYSFSAASWAVPINTPKDIQTKLEKALLQSFEDPMVKEIIKRWNMAYDPLDAQTVTNLIATDYKRFGELAKKMGIGIYKK